MTTGEEPMTGLDLVLGQWGPIQTLVEAIPDYERRLQMLQRGDYDLRQRKRKHRIDRIDALNHLGALVLVHEPIPRNELEDKMGLSRNMFASLMGGLTAQWLVEALHPHDERAVSSRYAYISTEALRWGLQKPDDYTELAAHYARLKEHTA